MSLIPECPQILFLPAPGTTLEKPTGFATPAMLGPEKPVVFGFPSLRDEASLPAGVRGIAAHFAIRAAASFTPFFSLGGPAVLMFGSMTCVGGFTLAA